MRARLVAGNWKMHGSLAANARLLEALKAGLPEAEGLGYAVCAPYPYLAQVAQALSGSRIAWGAQNVSEHDSGAYTGEVSGAMLREFGCRFAIVGHSERRALYGEDDGRVAAKFLAARRAGLTPILCVGETLEQRDQGKARDVVSEQIVGGLSGLTASDLDRIIVAYEPVWAIGTGRTATPEQAQEMHAFIRRVFAERHSQTSADDLRILYGGSVKPDNTAGLMKQVDIDGALVGGASLNAESFAKIVNYK